MGKTDFKDELEGLHFDILNDYIEKGSTGDMPEEMLEYMDQLKFIQQRLDRVESPNNVMKSLLAFYPSLGGNMKKAQSRFNDALHFFHLDRDTSKDMWRNLLFEIGYKGIQLFIKTAKDPDAFLKLPDALKKLSELKGLHLPDETPIDPKLLEEKNVIYTLTPSDVGLPEANRQSIAAQIDQMPLKEDQKLKLKMDAGLETRAIFTFENEQTKDQ